MHKISASKFRLGYSTTWNLVNSPLYFFIAFRLNLILNTYIRCILKFFRIRLVKWFINIEVYYIKLGLIVFSASKGSFSRIAKQKIKRRRRQAIFPIWNYTYIDQATRYTKLLHKYCVRKEHDKKLKWTLWVYDNAPKKRKCFPAIFYRLGKRRSKLKRKKGKWKKSLENIATIERDSDMIKKRNYFKSMRKFAQFPALQMQHFLSFKISLMLLKFSRVLSTNNQNFLLKIKILSFIIYLNLYIKNYTSKKKNKATLRLINSFLSKDLRHKKRGGGLSKRFKFPKCKLFFDYFSYIKGLNDEFVSTRGKFGSIVSISKKRAVQKYNTPWSSFFNIGLFMPYSYKRLVRKLFINFKIKKIKEDELFQIKQDKILLIDYFIKFFVFDKDIPELGFSSKISVNSFFFNRKMLSFRLQNIKNLLLKKIKLNESNKNLLESKKFYRKINIQKRLKLYKNLYNFRFSNFLLSGKIQYVWNNVKKSRPHSFDTAYLKGFIYQMRSPFQNKFKLFKSQNNLNLKKVYKFFLIKYIKSIVKCLITKKLNSYIQQYDPNLVSGSKNLEKYIKLYNTEKYFLYAVKSIYKNSEKKEFDFFKYKIYNFMLRKFIKLNYNNFYNKLFVQFAIKLVKFNVLFYRYKLLLSQFSLNYFDIKTQLNYGKKNRKSSILRDNKSYLLYQKKKNSNSDNSKKFSNCSKHLYVYLMIKLAILQKSKLVDVWNLFFSNFSLKVNYANLYKYNIKFYSYLKKKKVNNAAKKWFYFYSDFMGSRESKGYKKIRTQNSQLNNLNFFNFAYAKNIKKFILNLNSFYKLKPPVKKLINLKNSFISKKKSNAFFLYFQNLINNKLSKFDKAYSMRVLKNFKKNKNKFLLFIHCLISIKTAKKKKSQNYLAYKMIIEQFFLNVNNSNFNQKYNYTTNSLYYQKYNAQFKKISSSLSIDFLKRISEKNKQNSIFDMYFINIKNDLNAAKKKLIFFTLLRYCVKRSLIDMRTLRYYRFFSDVLLEEFVDSVNRERKHITFYKPAKVPEKEIKPKFKYLTDKQIKRKLFKLYYRINNAFERKYEFKKIQEQKKVNGKWITVNRITKFYKKKPKIFWAEKVFQSHRWSIKKIHPPVYRKIYQQIKRLENKIFIGTPDNQKGLIKFNALIKRRKFKNHLKIARNLGKQLFFRKKYLKYMFSINWAKEENPYYKTLFLNDSVVLTNRGYFGFFPLNKKTKNANYRLKVGFNKNIFNFRKSEFYKNKCLLGLDATQSIKNKWFIFNNYLKKKIKFNINFFFNENNVLSNTESYGFFLDSFLKIYRSNKHANIWKIKKRVFFDKLFWWNKKYRLIRTRQEQRRRRRCTRKSRFKACVRVRKDYKYGMRMITSSVIANEDYTIHKGYRFFGFQVYLKNRIKLKKFKDRFNRFFYIYHAIYPENMRTDLLDTNPKVGEDSEAEENFEPREILEIKKGKLGQYPWFLDDRTVTLRKISWYRNWLKFTKMLNVYRYWTSIGGFFKRNMYSKFSISKRLDNFKTVQYYTLKFYKFKNSLLLEDYYLKITKFASIYALSGLLFIPSYNINYNYYKVMSFYFKHKFFTSTLKLKTLNSYISLFFNFNIKVISQKPNFRLRKLSFFSAKNTLNFKIKTSVMLLKNIMYMFSKLEKSNFFFNFNSNLIVLNSQNDLMSNNFVVPKFNYLKVTDQIKFIKLVISENIDFSLFKMLSYKESLERKDFAVALKYVIYNNLVKFFKSTKLEKNFIMIEHTLKFYFLWLIKMFLLKKFCFTKAIKNKLSFVKKNQNFNLLQKVFLSYSANYFINYNIQAWKNFQRLSRKSNSFFKHWLRKKKFLFWITSEFEKDLKQKVNIYFINSLTAITTNDRINTKNFFKTIKWVVSPWNRRKGWRNNIIFTDILWTTLIAMKYHCVSFLAENISKQLCKRKKHWRYIQTIKKLVSRTLPKLQFKKGIGDLHTIKISINGKVNGRDRSINYIFFKKVKDKQKPRIHQLYLHINYGFREALSKYGVFAIKIWFSRI